MADLREYPRAKEGSTISKIVVDRDLCIAAVSCMAVAAETWELDEENKIVVRMQTLLTMKHSSPQLKHVPRRQYSSTTRRGSKCFLNN